MKHPEISEDIMDYLKKIASFIDWDDPKRVAHFESTAAELCKNGFPFEANNLLEMICCCLAIIKIGAEQHEISGGHTFPPR